MHHNNNPQKFFEDMARMMGGAFATADASRHEIENWFKSRMEGFYKEQGLVTREEFEVLKEMLAEARLQQQVLQERLEKLEAASPKK